MQTHSNNFSRPGIYAGLPEAMAFFWLENLTKHVSFMEILRESTLYSMTYALLNSGSLYYGTFSM